MVISIFKFLAKYYGVTLNAGSTLSHKELKKKYRFLRRCSFKFAGKNKDLVQSGKIIYVRDSYDVIFPYMCPEIIYVAKKDCDFLPPAEKEDENDPDILDQLADLPTYQVRELLSRYKYVPSFYKVIKRELIDRGVYENKKYRLLKEIVGMKESGFNDKYQRRRKIKCKES